MKKLFAVLTVFFAVQSAHATSILSNVLSFERVQKSTKQTSHSLRVYVNGAVVDRDSKIGRQVATLSAHQMDRIERLVRRSQPVRTRFEPSMARCFAPAFQFDRYTANNGTVFLKQGAICDGGFTVNDSRAARKLVNVLQALEQAAHNNRLSPVALDRQIDELLD